MIIRFFSSFCDSTVCKNAYETMCETHKMSNYGPDKSLYITANDDYTHVIILNTAMPEIKEGIPKSNVIGFALEPHPFLGITEPFLEYASKYINKYYIGEKKTLPDPFIQGQGYLWYNTPLVTMPSIKPKFISITISKKSFAPGHKYRHSLVKTILRTNLPVDIYGKGCQNYRKRDSRLKGKFTAQEPYESYQFHICIENFQEGDYFSEKITNALLCETTPIYWGSLHIHEYFPNMVYDLTGNLNRDIHFLFEIAKNPSKYRKSIDSSLIKNKINLLENINGVFV
jgi:hypothetical protein